MRLPPDRHQIQLIERDERHLLTVRRQRRAENPRRLLLRGRREVVALHRIRSPRERHPRRERDIRHCPCRHIPVPDLPVGRIDHRVVRQPRRREREHILIARHRLAIDKQLRQRPAIDARRPSRGTALPHVREALPVRRIRRGEQRHRRVCVERLNRTLPVGSDRIDRVGRVDVRDMRTIRRPRRVVGIAQHRLMRDLRQLPGRQREHPYVVATARSAGRRSRRRSVGGKGNLCPIRREHRFAIVVEAERQLTDIRAVRIHRPNMEVPTLIRLKRDCLPVR